MQKKSWTLPRFIYDFTEDLVGHAPGYCLISGQMGDDELLSAHHIDLFLANAGIAGQHPKTKLLAQLAYGLTPTARDKYTRLFVQHIPERLHQYLDEVALSVVTLEESPRPDRSPWLQHHWSNSGAWWRQ